MAPKLAPATKRNFGAAPTHSRRKRSKARPQTPQVTQPPTHTRPKGAEAYPHTPRVTRSDAHFRPKGAAACSHGCSEARHQPSEAQPVETSAHTKPCPGGAEEALCRSTAPSSSCLKEQLALEAHRGPLAADGREMSEPQNARLLPLTLLSDEPIDGDGSGDLARDRDAGVPPINPAYLRSPLAWSSLKRSR